MENEFIKTNNGITYLDLTRNENWKSILKSTEENTIIHQIYLDPNNRKLIFSLSQNLFHASID